jgi:hypothetical protein
MRAVQGAGPGSIPGSVQNKALMFAPTAANVAFPARPMAMPFSIPAYINPSSANSHAPNQVGPAGGTAQQAATRTTIAAPPVSNAVTRSRRQQADLMLAQWAAQQMAQQNGVPAVPAKKDDTPALGPAGRPDSRMTVPTATAATAATGTPATSAQEHTQAHPMLPPRNASPEWYTQAMDQALNRYRKGAGAGAGAGAGTSPAISLRR